MPKGVEHEDYCNGLEVYDSVSYSQMPKGVEHKNPNVRSDSKQVSYSQMPKGVEHTGRIPPSGWRTCCELFSDAERR